MAKSSEYPFGALLALTDAVKMTFLAQIEESDYRIALIHKYRVSFSRHNNWDCLALDRVLP